MPLITVDPELCLRDGICAAECPMKIIDFSITYAAMMVGYPKYKYHRMPTRKPADVVWR